MQATYLGQEQITVPYGTCTDCIKVHYRTYREGVIFFDETYWFSWNEGIVKYHATVINHDPYDLLLEIGDIQFP